jgi:predicted nucleotidyltransferase
MLERLLRSRAEVAVLNVVLFTDGLHLREIARRAGVSSYEAKKELDSLVQLGILLSEKKGNQVFFHANEKCSFLEDLRNLFSKTEGIIVQIRERLRKAEGIRYCFIFGSAAAGRISEKSDIDLLVIGEISEEKLASLVLELQKSTRREINFILWTEKDFHKKLAEKSAFLGNITKKKIVWVSGDYDEFAGLVKEAYD